MAVSDRIAVMHNGEIQHVGTPRTIYRRPANLFVAQFIGRTNTLPCRLDCSGATPQLAFAEGLSFPVDHILEEERRTQDVVASIRPEELTILPEESGVQGLHATIKSSVFLGINAHYYARLDTGEEVEILLNEEDEHGIQPGTRVILQLSPRRINLFRTDTQQNIVAGVDNHKPGGKAGVAE